MPVEPRKKGETIEGFRILDEIGRGAASIIYLVHDPKTKRIWALKQVVKDTVKDQRFLDQAEGEFKVASKLNHDRIRKIDRVIRKKESLLGGVNELYLVMEHVDGASAQDEPPKTFEDAAWVFEQTAQGLAYMHDQGFVHADMKPNNIIVDDKNNVKIIDLGQSCKLGTIKERIQGTPEYIAPEQVHRRAITGKTDVYNLGAAIYWALTRQYVPSALGGQDSLVSSLDDAMIPKAKPVQELNPRVPDMLAELTMACVQIDPDDRPEMPTVVDRLNLIRGKLHAEAVMKKSGRSDKIDGNGSRGPGGSGGPGESRAALAGKAARAPKAPPIDPGLGIDDAGSSGTSGARQG